MLEYIWKSYLFIILDFILFIYVYIYFACEVFKTNYNFVLKSQENDITYFSFYLQFY